MKMPIWNPIVTSTFGPRIFKSGKKDFHTGIDFVNVDMRNGEEVICRAVLPGVIDGGFEKDGFGNYVVLKCNDHNGRTLHIYYSHLKLILASKGATVKEGDEIGIVGTSGNSTGVHLHFEVRTARGSKYNAIDPTEFLRIPNVEGLVEFSVPIKTRDGSIIQVEGRNMGDRNMVFLTEVPKIVLADSMSEIIWNSDESIPEII